MIHVNVDSGHNNKPRASHHEARELQQGTSGSILHPTIIKRRGKGKETKRRKKKKKKKATLIVGKII